MDERRYAVMKGGQQVGLLVAPLTRDLGVGLGLNFGSDDDLANAVRDSLGRNAQPRVVLNEFILPRVAADLGLTFLELRMEADGNVSGTELGG